MEETYRILYSDSESTDRSKSLFDSLLFNSNNYNDMVDTTYDK